MSKSPEDTKSSDVELHILIAELNFGCRILLHAILDERKLKFKEAKDKIKIIERQLDCFFFLFWLPDESKLRVELMCSL